MSNEVKKILKHFCAFTINLEYSIINVNLNNRLYRVSKKEKCYTGALCGLGYDQQLRRPMYLEDDIEDLFETEFQDEDIRHVSYYMNK